jgi:hypothetical protein
MADQGPEAWPADTVRRMPSPAPRYLLYFDDQVRVVFQLGDGGKIHIQDLFSQEFIDNMFGKRPSPPAAV